MYILSFYFKEMIFYIKVIEFLVKGILMFVRIYEVVL